MDFVGTALGTFQKLEHTPSELVRRPDLEIAPVAGEPIGWVIDQVGPDLLVDASDSRHPEGAVDQSGSEKTLIEWDRATLDAFYSGKAEVIGLR